MNLTHDAMLVSLRINAWSGRLYDRQASNHVAAHHDASASAGRYNKRLLPKAAFAALTATMSAARSSHYDQSLPWDDQGSRLLTVANYERKKASFRGRRTDPPAARMRLPSIGSAPQSACLAFDQYGAASKLVPMLVLDDTPPVSMLPGTDNVRGTLPH